MFNNFTAEKEYESCNTIIPSTQSRGALLLGDFNSATDVNLLTQHSIKTVITSAAGLDHLQIPNFVTHIVYPLKDAKSQNIRAYFNESYITIDRRLDEGGVLVHCAAGVSRSATLIIAYLMKKNQISFKSAINCVRSKRQGICPNLGFELQLKKYEQQLMEKEEPPKKLQKKNASEVFTEDHETERSTKIENKSFFQFSPAPNKIHSKKKNQHHRPYKAYCYSKPKQRPLYDVMETNLFVSGKSAQRPSSKIGEGVETIRNNQMLGTWGPTKNKYKKY